MRIILPSCLVVLTLLACEEEARKFDISKEISVPYYLASSETDTTSFDSLIISNLVNNPEIAELAEYVEQYTVNLVSVELLQDSIKTPVPGLIEIQFPSFGSQQYTAILNDVPITGLLKAELNLPQEVLLGLSSLLNSGEGIPLSISATMDRIPVGFILVIHYDITSSVYFDF